MFNFLKSMSTYDWQNDRLFMEILSYDCLFVCFLVSIHRCMAYVFLTIIEIFQINLI
jgi:hypothetical protein